MPNIILNGEPCIVRSNNLQDLIAELKITGKRIAIEVNLEIIPRSLFLETLLKENDRVEIVHAIGGG